MSDEKKGGPMPLTDFYNKLPRSMKPTYHNPGFENHGLELPMRAVILGMPGAGKTTLMMELLRRMQKNIFKNNFLCTID